MRNSMKNKHIDWLNAQDDTVIAPVEGHEGYRVVKAMRVSTPRYAYDVIEEDCGWFGYEGLCED